MNLRLRFPRYKWKRLFCFINISLFGYFSSKMAVIRKNDVEWMIHSSTSVVTDALRMISGRWSMTLSKSGGGHWHSGEVAQCMRLCRLYFTLHELVSNRGLSLGLATKTPSSVLKKKRNRYWLYRCCFVLITMAFFHVKNLIFGQDFGFLRSKLFS